MLGLSEEAFPSHVPWRQRLGEFGDLIWDLPQKISECHDLFTILLPRIDGGSGRGYRVDVEVPEGCPDLWGAYRKSHAFLARFRAVERGRFQDAQG